MVIPPDSEIVAKFCTLVEPARCLIEEYGVVVGHTLVDASSGSGSVLIINPKAEVVVLPSLTRQAGASGGDIGSLRRYGTS